MIYQSNKNVTLNALVLCLFFCGILKGIAQSTPDDKGEWMDSHSIRFSQSSVSYKFWGDDNYENFSAVDNPAKGEKSCAVSMTFAMLRMQKYGDGFPPIDVVRMPDGQLTSIDNRRLLAAKTLGYPVRVIFHDYNEPSSNTLKKREPGAKTWGEAIILRLNRSGISGYGTSQKPEQKMYSADKAQYNRLKKELERSLNISPDDDDDPTPPPPPTVKKPNATVNVNTDAEHIKQVKKENGNFPGGILMNEVKGSTKFPIHSVNYDFEHSAFIINGQYKFETELTAGEVADLIRLSQASDRRLGVLSQKEGINISADNFLMFKMTEADAFLGKIVYGYDMKGRALTKSESAKNYPNPNYITTKTARNWLFNWSEVLHLGERVLKGYEPRFFIEYKNMEFYAKPDNVFDIGREEIQINYQVFTTDITGNEQFVDNPDAVMPEVSAAISHLREHFTNYEANNAFLYQTQRIAATFAFLRYLHDQKIEIQNFTQIVQVPSNTAPFIYGFYNELDPTENCAKNAAAALSALEWIPNWLLNSTSKLKIAMLKLHYACEAQQAGKITTYRNYVQKLLDELDPTDPNKSLLSNRIAYFQSNDITGKLDFLQRYGDSHPIISKKIGEEVLSYYLGNTAEMPVSFNDYLQASWLAKKLGNQAVSDTLRKKGLLLATEYANTGGSSVQIVVGNAYETEEKYDSAAHYYQRAIYLGDPTGALHMGNLIGYTRGYHENWEEAYPYFLQASDKGLHEASFNVGYCLITGKGINANPSLAITYLTKAAEGNHANAQLWLGLLYHYGRGVNKNNTTARFWIRRSALQGLEEAKKYLYI